ncbi:hypothetical protein CORC01_01139 [Colletotrichum orchidophilum]|uniref:Uncharacterized protein n=1 Tax=Colletotrichum orchidophilum TaxID=1209926 RepID=A0A1G4BPM6_9PEZI|nr:uncharacterized protein CORC01_01139 [Colletotrichum orchidophilum]OHF03420.1 hypothetical protein CORC01_01139 [Colletotrichum orchidophilum]
MMDRGASRKLALLQLVTCSLSALLEWPPSGESKSSQAGLPPCFPLPSTISLVSKLLEATKSVTMMDKCPCQVVTARTRGHIRRLVPRKRNPANHLIGMIYGKDGRRYPMKKLRLDVIVKYCKLETKLAAAQC